VYITKNAVITPRGQNKNDKMPSAASSKYSSLSPIGNAGK